MAVGSWLHATITPWGFLTLSLTNEAADQSSSLKYFERGIHSHGLQKEQRTWSYKSACTSGTLGPAFFLWCYIGGKAPTGILR